MRQNILIIEDDKIQQLVLLTMLRSAGYEVAAASSGEEAIGMLPEYKPDVVITDMALSGMSGLEVLWHFKNSPDLAGIKFIVTTSDLLRPHEGEITSMGADYLVKPIAPGMLETVLRRI